MGGGERRGRDGVVVMGGEEVVVTEGGRVVEVVEKGVLEKRDGVVVEQGGASENREPTKVKDRRRKRRRKWRRGDRGRAMGREETGKIIIVLG